MISKSILNKLIRLIKHCWLNFSWIFWFNISKACKLIKMPSKSISWKIFGFISSAYETSSFYYIVSVIKSWCCKILIDRMNLKTIKWVNRSDCVLPNISNNIIEFTFFKEIDWIRRKPNLKINISNTLIFPRI